MMEQALLTNPFPGLRSFEEDEDYLFFGREKQTDELLKKLRTARFLAVVGSSGSGKSSLVKCGLLPSLHAGYMAQAGSSWKVSLFRPGVNPIGNMSESLCEALYESSDEEEQQMQRAFIEASLRRSDKGLAEVLRGSPLAPKTNLLVLVDQFEELFRFSRIERENSKDQKDSTAFISLLLKAAAEEDIRLYVVITMRSDFIGDCVQFRGLPEAINKGQYLVPKMTREERRLAITGPVAVGGAELSPRLEALLINEVQDDQDQLPILQHALMRTWDYWEQNRKSEEEPIDIVHYQATGGIAKALSRHAEEAFSELDSNELQKVCARMFKALTDTGMDSRGIRRPTKVTELASLSDSTIAHIRRIVEVFRRPGRSFLMPPHPLELNADTVIDISHESLMRVWVRLKAWVEEEAQSAEIYLRLARSAQLYQMGEVGLLTNPELQIALRWRTRAMPNADWASKYDPAFERAMDFLDRSKQDYDFKKAQKERRRRAAIWRVRIFAGVLGIAFIGAMVLAFIAFKSKRQAEESQIEAVLAQKETAKALKKAKEGKQKEAEAVEARNKTIDKMAKTQDRLRQSQDSLSYVTQQAIKAEREATRLKDTAFASARRADKQRQKARDAKIEADTAAAQALRSEGKALKGRMLAEARSLSHRAMQFVTDGQVDLARVLALHGHYLNKENKGPKQNADVYRALAQVATSGQRDDQHYVETKGKRYDIRALAIGPTGAVAFGTDLGVVGTSKKWSEGSFSQSTEHSLSAPVRSLTFIGNALLAGTKQGGLYHIREGATPAKLWESESKASLLAVCPLNQKDLLAVLTQEKLTVMRLDANASKSEIVGQLSLSKATAMQVLPGSGSLVVANSAGEVSKISVSVSGEASKGELLFSAKEAVSALALNPDKSRLAVGLASGGIALKNMASGSIRELVGHHSAITDLAFSSTGDQLASSSFDQSIRLWSIPIINGEDVHLLKEKKGWIYSIGYVPSGDQLISVSQGGLIQRWPTTSTYLAQKLCPGVAAPMSKEALANYTDIEITYKAQNCVSPID